MKGFSKLAITATRRGRSFAAAASSSSGVAAPAENGEENEYEYDENLTKLIETAESLKQKLDEEKEARIRSGKDTWTAEEVAAYEAYWKALEAVCKAKLEKEMEKAEEAAAAEEPK